jgi:multidrug resistance efflux pump
MLQIKTMKLNLIVLNNDLDTNSNLSSEITRLNELLKSGVLTQEEFDKAKKKLLDN